MNTVEAFVDAVRDALKGEQGVFENVCQQARDGRMGFGEDDYGDWGNLNTGAG